MPQPEEVGGPAGMTYAAVLVGAGHAVVVDALRRMRFTGRIAPPTGDWMVAVPARPAGTVAARRRGVIEVGAALAAELRAPVLTIRVLRDRQLVLVGWRDGQQTARYVSDPSFDHEDRIGLLSEPVGVESAGALAEICGRPDAEGDLLELLDRELDPDSFIESERLGAVLELLGLPSWVVSAWALPRELPSGPRRADFTRLGAGAPGAAGLVLRWGTERVRRHRRQPPVVPDPPRQMEIDPWLL